MRNVTITKDGQIITTTEKLLRVYFAPNGWILIEGKEESQVTNIPEISQDPKPEPNPIIKRRGRKVKSHI